VQCTQVRGGDVVYTGEGGSVVYTGEGENLVREQATLVCSNTCSKRAVSKW